ncbi:MAG: hypothetical protein K8S20_02050 [Chloroflexi bacterium]|nr:hypothetical protein [Chloroflexota bacterium]
MTIEYDEKGKYYTDVVTKLPVAAIIQTTAHLIRGFIHIRKGDRLKNELEGKDLFIAVTNAVVHDAEDKALYRASFMAVQRAQIVWILPVEGEPNQQDAS